MRTSKSKVIKVTLRFRMLNTGKQTLYLDYYYPPIKDPETGNPPRREYLGMLVTPLKKRNGGHQTNSSSGYKYTSIDEETIRLATIILNNRQNELNKSEIYTDAEREVMKAKERSKGNFIEFFQRLANERKESNHTNWLSAIEHFKFKNLIRMKIIPLIQQSLVSYWRLSYNII